jgi:hypothetical protein
LIPSYIACLSFPTPASLVPRKPESVGCFIGKQKDT